MPSACQDPVAAWNALSPGKDLAEQAQTPAVLFRERGLEWVSYMPQACLAQSETITEPQINCSAGAASAPGPAPALLANSGEPPQHLLLSSSPCTCPATARCPCCTAACFANDDGPVSLISPLKLWLLCKCFDGLLPLPCLLADHVVFLPAAVPGAATVIVANATASASAASLAQLACKSLLHLWWSHLHASGSAKPPSPASIASQPPKSCSSPPTDHTAQYCISAAFQCCAAPSHVILKLLPTGLLHLLQPRLGHREEQSWPCLLQEASQPSFLVSSVLPTACACSENRLWP